MHALYVGEKMKTILITLSCFIINIALAEAAPHYAFPKARILLIPQKSEIDLGETIDIDVYVVNCVPETISIPKDNSKEGYSNVTSGILCLSYGFVDGHLTITDRYGSGKVKSTHEKYDKLEYLQSKKYKIRYSAPNKDFEFIEYSIELEINGEATKAAAIIKRQRQQVAPRNR